MEKSLHLGDHGFNVAAALFYVFYAIFEVSAFSITVLLNVDGDVK